jgi:hypothetical protein
MIQDTIASFKASLEKGQLSTLALRELQGMPFDITYKDIKYSFTVTPKAPDVFVLTVANTKQEIEVRTPPSIPIPQTAYPTHHTAHSHTHRARLPCPP